MIQFKQNSISKIHLFPLLFILLLMGGCASQPSGTLKQTDQVYYANMSGQSKNALIKSLEQESDNIIVDDDFLDRLNRVSSKDNGLLCTRYCEAENFSKCNACLDSYLIREDIKKVMSRSCSLPDSVSPQSIGADYVNVINHIEQKARMCLIFSDTKGAKEYTSTHLRAVAEIELCLANGQSSKLGSEYAKYYIDAAELSALTNNRVEANAYLKDVDGIANNSGERQSKIYSEINKSQIIVHMALGEYKPALEILKDPKDYFNKTYGDRLGESLKNRAAYIGGAAVFAGLVGHLAGLDADAVLGVAAGVGAVGVAATMVEEGVAEIDLPYRNFQLGRCYYELGSYQDSKEIYEKLLLDTAQGENKYNQEIVYHNLGIIYFKEKNYTKASEYLKKAVAIIERHRSTLNTDHAKIGFVADKQEIYLDLVKVLVESQNIEEAFEFAERAKARALVDMLADKKSFGTDTMRNNSKKILEEMRQNEEKAAIQCTQNNSSQSSAYRGLNGLATDPGNNSAISSLITVQTTEYTEIQKLLSFDETMLEYYGNEKEMYAFVITRNDLRVVKLRTTGLKENVKRFRKHLACDFSEETNLSENEESRKINECLNAKGYITPGHSIYNAIFRPVKSLITTRNLTIVPHASLHNIPFSALHDGNKFLIEKYTIRMLPSASVLKYVHNKEAKNDKIVILSNPYIEDKFPGTNWSLDDAKEEGDAISQIHANTWHLNSKDATETELIKMGSVAAYLHIASHGQFNSDHPLESSLLLAKDDYNDGYLKVRDLYNLKLNNNMVVLSACETGLGEIKSGDDVISLTRGFLFAGAESIINSLWKVNSVATKNLMVDLYKNLNFTSKVEALRQSQLKLLYSEDTDNFQHPYYWSAFQLTGARGSDGKTLQQSRETLLADNSGSIAAGSGEVKNQTRSLRRKNLQSKFDDKISKSTQEQEILIPPPPVPSEKQQDSIIVTEEIKPDNIETNKVAPKNKPYKKENVAKVVYQGRLIVFSGQKMVGESTFFTSTENIRIGLTLDKKGSYSFITLVVINKSQKETIREIPIIVDRLSFVVKSSLKRPLAGWEKGRYEILAMDRKKNIISSVEFSIVE